MIDLYRRLAACLGARPASPLVLALVSLLLACHAFYTRHRLMMIDKEIMIFGSFWESGRAVGLGLDPYAIYPLVHLSPGDNPVAEVNMNPPSLLPLFELVAQVDPQPGRLLWLIVTLALFLLGAWAVFRAVRPTVFQTAWLLLFPAIPQDLALGQIYSLLFVLGVGAWLCLRSGRDLAAAICMGVLIAVKPNFGLWCLLTMVAGHWRPALTAAAVAAALTILPVWLYGLEVYYHWLGAVAIDRHYLFPSSIALYSLFARLEVPTFAYVPIAALVVWALVWCRRVRPSLYDLTPVAVLLGILCAPLAWFHYLVVISPFIVDRRWDRAMVVAIVLSVLERFWAPMADLDLAARIVVSLAAIAPALIMLPRFAARAVDSGDAPAAPSQNISPGHTRHAAAG